MKMAFLSLPFLTSELVKNLLKYKVSENFKCYLLKIFKNITLKFAEILPAPALADSPAPHTFLRELLSENNKLYTACKMQTLMESARFLKIVKKCERARMYYSLIIS